MDDYFYWCDSQKQIIKTEKAIKIVVKPYTVSGLCLYLGISRDTLCEYEKKFPDTVKGAKTRIENWIEEHAMTKDIDNVSAIFNLKNNFGWKDKQEIESKNENTNNNFNFDITPEERDRIIQEHIDKKK